MKIEIKDVDPVELEQFLQRVYEQLRTLGILHTQAVDAVRTVVRESGINGEVLEDIDKDKIWYVVRA